MVPLLFILNSEAHRAVVVDRPTVLGRSRRCDVRLESQSVSRRHAEVQWIEGSAWVRDLGSRNGTFVNGQRIHEPTRLHVGDRLRVGEVKLNYRVVAHLPLGRDPVAGTGRLQGMLTFRCGCGAKLGAKLEMVRSVHVCPRCGASLMVPELSPESGDASAAALSPRFDPNFREDSGAPVPRVDPHDSNISDDEVAGVLDEGRRDDDDDDDPPAAAPPLDEQSPAREPLPATRVRPIPTASHPADQVIGPDDIDEPMPRYIDDDHGGHHAFDVMHEQAQPRVQCPLRYGEDEAALSADDPVVDDSPADREPSAIGAVTWWSPGGSPLTPAANTPRDVPGDPDQLLLTLHDPEEDPVRDEALPGQPLADDSADDQVLREASAPTSAQATAPQVVSGEDASAAPPDADAEPRAVAALDPADTATGEPPDLHVATGESHDAAAGLSDPRNDRAMVEPPQVSGQPEPEHVRAGPEAQAQASPLPLVSEGRVPQDLLADAQDAAPAPEAGEPLSSVEPRGDEDGEEPRQSPQPSPGLHPRAEAQTLACDGDDARHAESRAQAGHVGVSVEADVYPHTVSEPWVQDEASPRQGHDEAVDVSPATEVAVLEAPGRALRSIWTRPAKGRITQEAPHVALAMAPPRPDERTEQVVAPHRWHRPLNLPVSVPWRQGAESPDAGRRDEAPQAAAQPTLPSTGVDEAAALAHSESPGPQAAQEQVHDLLDDPTPPRLSAEATPALTGDTLPQDSPGSTPGHASGAEAPDLGASLLASPPLEAPLLSPDRMEAGRHEPPRAMAWWDAAILPQTQAIILAWLESRHDLPAERPARSSHTLPHNHADEAHRDARALPTLTPSPQTTAAGDDHERQHVDEEDWWATPIVREHTGDEDLDA